MSVWTANCGLIVRCLYAVCLQAEDAVGGLVDHAGHMLFSFLKRFGVDWNINSQAVAVAQGGIVSRLSLRTAAGPFAGPDKLAVKDPLTGTCVYLTCYCHSNSISLVLLHACELVFH